METSRWRCDERAAEAAGANAPAEEEEEFGDGHEKEYEEEYEEDGSDGRAHTPLCSKLRDAVDHAGLNDFMRVILEPLEEVFHGRGEITISSFTNRRIDIGIPKGRTVTMKLTQGEDRSLAVERLASELMVHVTRLHIDTNLEAVSSALHDLIDQLAPEPAPEPEPEPAQPAPAGSGGHDVLYAASLRGSNPHGERRYKAHRQEKSKKEQETAGFCAVILCWAWGCVACVRDKIKILILSCVYLILSYLACVWLIHFLSTI
jgi:hypothetical protein